MSDLTLVRELYGDVSAAVQIVWPDSAGRMPWMCRMALAGQAISSFQLTFGRKREWLRLSDVIVCNAFRDGSGAGDWSRAVGAAVESWSLVEKIAKRSPSTVSGTVLAENAGVTKAIWERHGSARRLTDWQRTSAGRQP